MFNIVYIIVIISALFISIISISVIYIKLNSIWHVIFIPLNHVLEINVYHNFIYIHKIKIHVFYLDLMHCFLDVMHWHSTCQYDLWCYMFNLYF